MDKVVDLRTRYRPPVLRVEAPAERFGSSAPRVIPRGVELMERNGIRAKICKTTGNALEKREHADGNPSHVTPQHLTRHKISDREPCKAHHAAKAWMADTQNVSRSLARGSLHRLVRCERGSPSDFPQRMNRGRRLALNSQKAPTTEPRSKRRTTTPLCAAPSQVGCGSALSDRRYALHRNRLTMQVCATHYLRQA